MKLMTPNTVVHKEIVIHAMPEDIWHVLTNSELFESWLTDDGSLKVDTDWKIGSAITFTGILHGI